MNNKFLKNIFALLFLFCAASASAEAPKLPDNLQWQTNESDPIFADPNAKRGGRFRTAISSFPTTLRVFGPDTNSAEFALYLQNNMLTLIERHPITLNPIPELATHWAFGNDGKTVYFKLDPEARWSDGVPVSADDYLFTVEFMRSKFIMDPFSNDHYTNVISEVKKYDDYTIAVRMVNEKPTNELIFSASINPMPRHFHKLDEQWVRNYNWRAEPNTGPYQVSTVKKGKYIEYKRKQDWWANNKRFFRYRFNPDFIRIKIVRDFNVEYNYFAKGELDTFEFAMPRFWYKRAQGEPYEKGYIGKIQFYNDVPRSPFGMYLNQDDPVLSDINTRCGIAHSMNFEKLIHTILRSDYERLNHNSEGYGDYSNPNIRAREYDIAKADQYFDKAGWNGRGPDGIRTKGEQRLSARITYVSNEQTPYLVLLKEEAARAGFDLILQQLDSSAWGKQLMEKKHQIVWLGFTSGIVPEYWQHFHSDNAHKPQTNNVTNTDNKEVDAKIDAYRAAKDMSTRIKLAHDIQQLIYDSCAFIPAYKKAYFRVGFWRWIKMPAQHGTRTSDTTLFDMSPSYGGLFWIDTEEKEKVQKARILGEKFEPINIVDERWRQQSSTQKQPAGEKP